MRPRWLGLALSLGLLLLGAPRIAVADGNADEAELQFQLGADAYRASDFREALAHFLASNRLVPNRNVRFNIARCYERITQYADAYRWYLDALEGETDAQTIATIREALGRIAPNVAVLDVVTEPPGATIYVDRQDLGSVGVAPRQVAIAPGAHVVIASLPGWQDARSPEVQATIGQRAEVSLHLTRIVGHVHVDADRGTTVHVDDEAAPIACVAPCTVDVPPGIHLLYFRREGFRVLPRQVNVVANETASVRASSTPLTGSVVVTADEREALVEIDGHAVGFTPVVVANVAVGARRIRVSQRGFDAVERNVTVRENQQTDLGTVHLAAINEVASVSRVSEPIDDAPSSLSIITAQELEAFQYPTIAEALRGTRGVALTFDSTYTSLAVRGLGQPNDYGSRLLILQDGATLNDNLLYQSYTGFDGRTDLGDVDRIEFVRGPGSVLYGTGAVSGVVNLVTRPRDEPDGVWAGLSTYQNSVGRLRAGFHHNFSRDAGIWTSVAGAHSDGTDVTIPLPDGPAVAHGFDSFDALTVNGRAWLGAVSAQWFFTTRDERIPTGAYSTAFDDPHTRWRDTRAMFELRADPQLSDQVQLQARAVANYYRFDGGYRYAGDTPSTFDHQQETYNGFWLVGDVRLVWRPVSQVRVSLGGEIDANLIASMDGIDQGNFDPTVAPTSYLHEDVPYAVIAGYALVEWAPIEQLRISVGARLDWWTPFRTPHDMAGNALDLSVVAPSPRVAIIWKPLPSDVIKLMGGRAFRAPSPYQLFYGNGGLSQYAATAIMGNTLLPETVLSGDFEYTHHFDAEWSGLVAFHGQFAESVVDTVNIDPADPASAIYYRTTTTPILTAGADLEARREFRGGWMFSGTAGYLTAVRSDLFKGTLIPNVPQGFGSLRGVIPLGDTGARLALRATLEAPRKLVAPGPHDETDPALIVDAVLSGNVRQLRLRWAIGIYNLFDWRYAQPVAATFAAPVMPQAGRTFMASVDLTF